MEPFDFLWPALFLCVQNFTSFFMLETAQSVVVTAQRGLSNCAAAHVRSLEGTLLAWFIKITKVVSFESVEGFCKDLFLTLYFSLFSSMIFLPLCSLCTDDLAIWSSLSLLYKAFLRSLLTYLSPEMVSFLKCYQYHKIGTPPPSS